MAGIGAAVKRVYFSPSHLWAAEHFVRLASEIEAAHNGPPQPNIAHRAYVMNAVLSAAAFLEAAINELFDDVIDGHPRFIDPLTIETRRSLSGLWQRAEGWPVLEKYLLLRPFDKDARSYQDAQHLIRLRNALTHTWPKTRSSEDADDLSKALMHKFPANRLMANSASPYFPDHCLGAGCAAWAVASSRTFANEFFGRLQPDYQTATFDRVP